MKRKVFIICCVFLCLIVAFKIFQLYVLNNCINELDRFKNQENRYYSVEKVNYDSIDNIKVTFKKGNIIKHILNSPNIGEFCIIKYLDSEEEVGYNFNKKIIYNKKNLSMEDELNNIPIFMQYDAIGTVSKKEKIKRTLKIHYIIPTTYEGKKCYKISTNSEIVIVDRNTFLPVYSVEKMANSNFDKNINEYKYTFEVGTVTDEDVAVPDFSDYRIK